jgi:hypothetical protein
MAGGKIEKIELENTSFQIWGNIHPDKNTILGI